MKEKRLEKRRYLLNNGYTIIDKWRTGGNSLYHKNYIINEKGKLWQLIQSFTNDNEI
jgi:hypothetical protein